MTTRTETIINALRNAGVEMQGGDHEAGQIAAVIESALDAAPVTMDTPIPAGLVETVTRSALDDLYYAMVGDYQGSPTPERVEALEWVMKYRQANAAQVGPPFPAVIDALPTAARYDVTDGLGVLLDAAYPPRRIPGDPGMVGAVAKALAIDYFVSANGQAYFDDVPDLDAWWAAMDIAQRSEFMNGATAAVAAVLLFVGKTQAQTPFEPRGIAMEPLNPLQIAEEHADAVAKALCVDFYTDMTGSPVDDADALWAGIEDKERDGFRQDAKVAMLAFFPLLEKALFTDAADRMENLYGGPTTPQQFLASLRTRANGPELRALGAKLFPND